MPARTKPTLAEVLDTLTEKAPSLRAAGVSRGRIGDIEFVLEPPPEPFSFEQGDAPAESPTSPMQDPAPYGFRRGGRVPGYQRPERGREEV